MLSTALALFVCLEFGHLSWRSVVRCRSRCERDAVLLEIDPTSPLPPYGSCGST